MYDGRLVRLRAVEPADAELFWRWMHDREVTVGLTRRYPFALSSEHEWIAGNASPGFAPFSLGVETRADGRLIGACGFNLVEPENRRAELGIAIGDKTAWGQGYGTDAMRVLCRFGFDQMNLHRIQLSVYSDNVRAQRCYEKVGFAVEGRARQAIWKDGHWQDEIQMGLLAGELRDED